MRLRWATSTFTWFSVLALALTPVTRIAIAFGQIVDFETLPDGSKPTDGMIISSQYNVAPYWVTFELIGGSPSVGPRMAKVGPPITAFVGVSRTSTCVTGGPTSDDMPASSEPVGCFFLTDDGNAFSSVTYGLKVAYTVPVRQASGVLLDVDGESQSAYEEWTVRARRQDMSVISLMTIRGDSPAGNAVARPWQFSVTEDIYFITLEYTGTYPAGVGLAFDNFSPSSLQTNLSITKTGPSGPVVRGDLLSYTMTIANHGPAEATDVAVRDFLPPGTTLVSALPSQGSCAETDGLITCALGSLDVGQTATVSLTMTLSELVLSNTASVSSNEADSDPTDNTSFHAVEVACLTTSAGQPSSIQAPLSARASPSPAGEHTDFSFIMPEAGAVRVEVFDVSGRRVRTLQLGRLDGGPMTCSWDACDTNGHAVPAGVYMWRIVLNDKPIGQRKVVVVR